MLENVSVNSLINNVREQLHVIRTIYVEVVQLIYVCPYVYILRSRQTCRSAFEFEKHNRKQKLILALGLVLLDQLLGVLARVDGRRVQFSPLQMQLRGLFVLHARGFHLCRCFVHVTNAGTVCGTALHIHRVVHRIAEVSVLIGDIVQIIFYVEGFL